MNGTAEPRLNETEIAVDGTEIDFWVSDHGLATLPFAFTSADTIDASTPIAMRKATSAPA